jgi:hypothetical protein
MLYFAVAVLTIVVFYCILIFSSKINKKKYKKHVYKQSDMHEMLKVFFNKDINNTSSLTSQLKKRKGEKTTKVIILGSSAYWVSENVFYVGLAVDGKAKPETGVPLDTSELSKTDINKLLFILDTLKGGKANDSGSTGN